MFYVSQETIFYKKSGVRQRIYGGLFFALWGAYPVSHGIKNYEKALKHHVEILLNGQSIHVFPEGRKSEDGNVTDESHGGVAYLSWKTGAPIVPVAIRGVFGTTLGRFFLGKKRYALSFGRPLHPKDLFKNPKAGPSVEDYKKAAKTVMRHVHELHEKI